MFVSLSCRLLPEDSRPQFHSMVFIGMLQDYVSVDDEAIRIFSSSGMKKDIIMPSEDIDRVCHIRHINSFVGWKYKDCKLYVCTIMPRILTCYFLWTKINFTSWLFWVFAHHSKPLCTRFLHCSSLANGLSLHCSSHDWNLKKFKTEL